MTVVEIRGWMREQERLALRRLAFGKDVLEIGSYEGLSTINLAATARSVVAIDPFDGRATPKPGNTLTVFESNISSAGVEDKVSVLVGTSEEMVPTLNGEFDLVFIDGDHGYESVRRDIELALTRLRDRGLLAFHDYHNDEPGVKRAVDEMVAGGAQLIEQYDTIAVVSPKPLAPGIVKPIVVALAMPHRNMECNLGAACGIFSASKKNVRQVFFNHGTSVLTQCFNTLWCFALNARRADGVTHFAMLHNDVIPEAGWIDILLEEMARHDLDCISTVIPLKNHKGLTSTGLDTIGNPWSVRRLTLHEIFELPETFTAADVPSREDDAQLLLNTGCWLVKFDEPWVTGLEFRQQDRIVFSRSAREFAAQSISEDWDFSRQLHSRGCRLGATRKVRCQHERPEFNNKYPWGELSTDNDFLNHQQVLQKYREEHPDG